MLYLVYKKIGGIDMLNQNVVKLLNEHIRKEFFSA